jgi:hypothetical protein
MVRSPVDICLGTRPSQAEKSRPLANATPLPIAATIALEMIGPIPGTVITLRQLSSLFANASISSVTVSIRSSSRRQSPASSATMRAIEERQGRCEKCHHRQFLGPHFFARCGPTNAWFYQPPTFHECKATGHIDLYGTRILIFRRRNFPGWTTDSDVVIRLRALRKLADETENHDLERDLYIAQGRARHCAGKVLAGRKDSPYQAKIRSPLPLDRADGWLLAAC